MSYLADSIKGKAYVWLTGQKLDVLGRFRAFLVFNREKGRLFLLASAFYLAWLIFTMCILKMEPEHFNFRNKRHVQPGKPESCFPTRSIVRLLAREYLEYDVIVLDVMHTLVLKADETSRHYIDNPYMKLLVQILQENKKPLVIFNNTALPVQRIQEILLSTGYRPFAHILSCDAGQIRKNLRKLYPTIDTLRVIHVGGRRRMIYSPQYAGGWKYDFYRNIEEIGALYRPQYITSSGGQAYQFTVNRHLHSGLGRYTLPYEYGFIYGGFSLIVYCRWLHYVAKKRKYKRILFCSSESEIAYKAFRILCKDMECDYTDRPMASQDYEIMTVNDPLSSRYNFSFVSYLSYEPEYHADAIYADCFRLIFSPLDSTFRGINRFTEIKNSCTPEHKLAQHQIQKGIFDFIKEFMAIYGNRLDTLNYEIADIIKLFDHLHTRPERTRQYFRSVFSADNRMDEIIYQR